MHNVVTSDTKRIISFQIIGVDSSQMKFQLDIEPSQCLAFTLTGNNIPYGGSHKRKKYKVESLELLELADDTI